MAVESISCHLKDLVVRLGWEMLAVAGMFSYEFDGRSLGQHDTVMPYQGRLSDCAGGGNTGPLRSSRYSSSVIVV